ncbi:hypothetical protein [Aeoliella sp.]|uniref:hypothetical protein n=1 Tax=Aeoliella sp. TaxID=2795800 RepID=UPI003CCBE3A9
METIAVKTSNWKTVNWYLVRIVPLSQIRVGQLPKRLVGSASTSSYATLDTAAGPPSKASTIQSQSLKVGQGVDDL